MPALHGCSAVRGGGRAHGGTADSVHGTAAVRRRHAVPLLTAACTRERLRGGSGCGLALAVTQAGLMDGVLALACMAGAGIIMRAIAPGLEERPEVFERLLPVKPASVLRISGAS